MLDQLLDHVVGGHLDDHRNVEAQCLRGFEIDHKLEFGWLLDRDVGRLRPSQNLIDKVCRVPS